MVRGRYLKSAERACATKARFDSQQTAERTAEYRYRAYQCPICHHWHLTSQSGPATAPISKPEKPPAPLARLGDLEWKELKPRGEPSRPVSPPRHQPNDATRTKPSELDPDTESAEATIRTLPDRHHRVIMVHGLKLVKSDPVVPELRHRLRVNDTVLVEGQRIMAIKVTITDSSST